MFGPSAFNECVKIMDEVAAAMEKGQVITWVPIPKELRWSWTNETTLEKWYVKQSTVRRIVGVDVLHREIIIDFVLNKKNALEAKKWLSKIDGLKVFL